MLLTERGTTFGYGRLVNDFRAIPQMQATGARSSSTRPTRSSSRAPGPAGRSPAGEREMIPYLARAAVAAGCDALFLEVHPRPEEALSDGPNALRLDDLAGLLRVCLRIREAITVPDAPGPPRGNPLIAPARIGGRRRRNRAWAGCARWRKAGRMR